MIKNTGILILTYCILISLPGRAGAQQTRWQTFESLNGNFSIQVPGYFQEHEQTIDTKIGGVTMYSFVHQPLEEDAENSVYLVSYCDYPSETLHEDSLELVSDFLQVTVDEAIFGLDGELMYADSTDWQQHPARFWRIDYLEGNAVMKTRAIIIKNRLYLIQVASLRPKAINPTSERFFDSFKLLSP
jgi:hypothetical protein